MMRIIINSLLMVLVAIAGLQVSHAIRGHAVEDNNKVIKMVAGNSNIVQNLGADGDKMDWDNRKALGVDLSEKFDNIPAAYLETVGDLISADQSALSGYKPKVN
ncbi:hypothetical protein MKX03_030925 [Papaver bracteatum]|nr:hypothetical protein MKX03_030925 [Papaver bracteatum]